MNNRKVSIINNTNAVKYSLIFMKFCILNIFLILLFPLIIYLIGYENYWDNRGLFIIIILAVIILDIIGALIFFVLASKRIVVLQENDKILFWKIPKKININASGQVNVGNVIMQNSDDAFSSIIGLILVTNGVKEAYNSIQENRDLGKITNYEMKDLLRHPYLKSKYYENCKVIKDTKSFTLYSGDALKKDGTFFKNCFKIKKDYDNKKIKYLKIIFNILVYILIIALTFLNINKNMTKEYNFLNDLNIKLSEFQIEKVTDIGNTNFYESSDFDINISYKYDSIKDFSITTTNTDLEKIEEIIKVIYDDKEMIQWFVTNITSNLNNLMVTNAEQFSECKEVDYYYNNRVSYNEQNVIEIYFSAMIY